MTRRTALTIAALIVATIAGVELAVLAVHTANPYIAAPLGAAAVAVLSGTAFIAALCTAELIGLA